MFAIAILGALGLLQSNQADFWFKGEPGDHLNEPFVHKTIPFTAENIVLGQQIFEKSNVNYFNLLSNFNLGFEFFFYYSLFLITFGFSCLLLTKFTIKSNRNFIKRFYLFLSYISRSELFKFKIIYLFLLLFFWFTQLFLANNIKTNKVSYTKHLNVLI